MLSEITGLLKQNGRMSPAELALHFHTEPSALEPMLALLESKGRIRRIASKCAGCKGCAQVKPADAVFFEAV